MTSAIHRIEGNVMPVNAYVVEAADGVVIVDGMLTVSDARAVRRRIEDLKKPILGAIITHAHPDHYAGLAEILRGVEVPIASTAAVRTAIERDDAIKNAIVGPMMGPEWPRDRIFPNHDVAPGATIRFSDLAFRVEDLGPGESPADSLWKLDDRSIFVGDLVYAGMHAYLADGFASTWRTTLDHLEQTTAPGATLYVGHGPPGGTDLFAAQRRYIDAFTTSIARHKHRAPADRKTAVIADMKRILPSDDLLFLMELSIDPFAEKLDA